VENETKRFIKKNGLAKYVFYHGIVPHNEAVRKTRKNDLLLVLLYQTEYSKSIVPHKLYHYLGMGKPIMAIAEEDGEVANIINTTMTGKVVSIIRPDRIFDILAGYYDEWKGCGTLKYAPDSEEIKKYDITFSAKKVCDIVKSYSYLLK